MNLHPSQTVLEWSEVIVAFNSLVRNIEFLRKLIDSDSLEDDDLYDTEEELNDYLILLAKLRQRYSEISDKGELPDSLLNKIRELC